MWNINIDSGVSEQTLDACPSDEDGGCHTRQNARTLLPCYAKNQRTTTKNFGVYAAFEASQP